MRGWVCDLLIQVLFGLSSTITAGVIVPQNLRPYLTASFETGFPFCYLLQLTGLWRKYTSPPPHGVTKCLGVEFVTDCQLASLSGCRATLCGPWPDFKFILAWYLLASSCIAPPLMKGWVCILQHTSLTGRSREGHITVSFEIPPT
jgi:hypothetical protein